MALRPVVGPLCTFFAEKVCFRAYHAKPTEIRPTLCIEERYPGEKHLFQPPTHTHDVRSVGDNR